MTEKLYPSTGCWIDGHWGHYASARLVQIAVSLGWDDRAAFRAAEAYLVETYLVDKAPEVAVVDGVEVTLPEYVYGSADDAENWINDNVVPEGFHAGWSDGEFFMMPTEWWQEN